MTLLRRPSQGGIEGARASWLRNVFLACIAMLIFACAPAGATLLYGGVAVSDGGGVLGVSNGSRSIGAGPDGTIYVGYQSSTQTELRVARSIDRGQSFEPSVQAYAVTDGSTIAAAETSVSTAGGVFVASVLNSGQINLSRSFDNGVTFTTTAVGTSTSTTAGIHVSTDGHRVYVAAATSGGVNVFASSDDGATFSVTSVGMTIAFFNLLVDPVNGDVVLAADTPAFHVRVSHDFGATFDSERNPAGTDYYSAWAISSGPSGRYLIVGGSNLGSLASTAARIDLSTFAAQNLTAFGSTGTAQTRSIAADNCGNVVDSYRDDGAGASALHVSNDLGSTFAAASVVAGSAQQSVFLNPQQGDVLFVYTSGGSVFLNTYSDETPTSCYQPVFVGDPLDFGGIVLGTSSAPMNAVITNNATSAVQIVSVTTVGDFAQTGSCVGSLAAGASCTIPVTFTPTGVGLRPGQLQVRTTTSVRTLALGGTGTDYALAVTVAGNGTVSAGATPTPNSGGIVDCDLNGGANCAAHYSPNAVVPLIATPAAGAYFVGWSGDAACSNGSVVMDSDHGCTATFAANTVAGTAIGVTGSGLSLHLHYGSGTEDLPVAAAASAFAFAAAVPTDAQYTVTVGTQPSSPGQTCTVSNGSGTLPAGGVDNVVVACMLDSYTIGGSVSGLAANGLVLQLNGGNDLPVASASTRFAFSATLATGSLYAVTIRQQPTGELCTLANASGTVADANVGNVAVSCVVAQAQLVLSTSDSMDFARYGQVVDYLVTLTNNGNATATAVPVTATYSAAFDVPNASWTCINGGDGATCTASGSGAFSDTVDLPVNRSITWLVSLPVLPATSESTAEFDVSATGAGLISDTDTLVIFRDGFDQVYANKDAPVLSANAANAVLAGDTIEQFTLTAPQGPGIDDVLVLDGATHSLRVQRIAIGAAQFVRLLERANGQAERASAWSQARSGELAVASVTAGAHGRVVLLHGAAGALSLSITQ